MDWRRWQADFSNYYGSGNLKFSVFTNYFLDGGEPDFAWTDFVCTRIQEPLVPLSMGISLTIAVWPLAV